LYGQNIPLGETKQAIGPGASGQYGLSPLSQITGLLSGIGSFLNTGSSSSGSSGSAAPVPGTNPYNLGTDIQQQLVGLGNTALKNVLGLKSGGGVGYADGGASNPVAGMKPIKLPSHAIARLNQMKSQG
jgi:hypothetical protein